MEQNRFLLEDDDEDDEIVNEIDVYVTNQLKQNISLLQYPLRPNWKPYDKNEVSKVCFKPKQHELLMKIKRDTTPKYYSIENDPLTRIASTRSLGFVDETKETSIEHGEYLTLRSSFLPLNPDYALGYYHHGELHLTALLPAQDKLSSGPPGTEKEVPFGGGVLQLRPDFSFVDEALEKQKKEEEKESERARKREMDLNQQSNLGPTTSQAEARPYSAYAMRKGLEKEAKEQARAEEIWVNLEHSYLDESTIIDDDSPGCMLMNKLLYSGYDTIPFNSDKEKYLSMLNPKQENTVIQNPKPSGPPGRQDDKSARCGLCLGSLTHYLVEDSDKRECPLLRSPVARACGKCKTAYLSCPCPKPQTNDENYREEGMTMLKLSALTLNQQVPILMMTMQVSHISEVVRLTNQPEAAVLPLLLEVAIVVRGCFVVKSELTCPSAFEAAARNLFLLWIQLHGSASKTKWMEQTQITENNAKKILDKLAALDSETRLWSLRLQPDPLLGKKYSEYIESYEKQWESAKAGIEGAFAVPPPKSGGRRGRGTGGRGGAGGGAGGGGRGAPVASFGGASSPSLSAPTRKKGPQQTRQSRVRGGSEMDLEMTPVEDSSLSSEIDSQKGTPSPSPSPAAEAQSPLEKFLTKLFEEHGVLKYSFIRTLTETQFQGSQPTEQQLSEALEKIAIVVRSVYVRKQTGNEIIDKCRPSVIRLFQKKVAIKRADAFQAIKEDVGSDPSVNVFTKIIHELATRKNTKWFFKAGDE